MKIAIFDSGIGGLCLLSELRRRLPNAEFIYYADSDHAPYGEREVADVLSLTEEAVDTSGTYEDRGYFSLGDRVVDVAEMTAQYTGAPETYEGLSETQCDYIRRIAELCKERGIKLLFVSAPMTPSYIPLNPVLDRASADVKALCDSLGVPFYDLSASAEAIGLTDAHFADRIHFNRAGAEAFSRYFADYLTDIGFYSIEKGN